MNVALQRRWLLMACLALLFGAAGIFYNRRNLVSIKNSQGQRLEVPRSEVKYLREPIPELWSVIDASYELSGIPSGNQFDACKAASLMPRYNQECLSVQQRYSLLRTRALESSWNPSNVTRLLGSAGEKIHGFMTRHPTAKPSDLALSSPIVSQQISDLSISLLPVISYKAIMTALDGSKSVHNLSDRMCYHPSLEQLIEDSEVSDFLYVPRYDKIGFLMGAEATPDPRALESLHAEVCLALGLRYLPESSSIRPKQISDMYRTMNTGYFEAARREIRQAEEKRREQEEIRRRVRSSASSNVLPTASQLLKAIISGESDPFSPGP